MPLRPVASASDPDPAHPWEDPKSFHTKTREDNTISVTVRIPQTASREIMKIVQSGKYPGLDTTSDVFRDAIWRWLRWMSTVKQDENMAKSLDSQRSQWRLEAELDRQSQLVSTIDTAERILEDAEHGEKTKLRVLKELSRIALRIEEGSDLRVRIIALVSKYQPTE